MQTDDSLVSFGDAVKALGNGRLGGYILRYGSADAPDIQGDYFDAETAFGAHIPGPVDTYYHHGLPRRNDPYAAEFGNRPIGVTDIKAMPDGLYAETTLDVARPAVARLYAEFEAGKYLGYSSGSDNRLVRCVAVKAGVRRVTQWPINDATVSPVPVDRRNRAHALKAMTDDDAPDDGAKADARPCPKCGKGLSCPDCGKAPTKAHDEDNDPEAVAAEGLLDRSARLVADCEELACLYAKAADQRHAEGRHLSRDKRDAIKALSDSLARFAAIPGARADPEAVLALRRRIALGRV